MGEIIRFPRLSGITAETKQRERLLWRTYNKLRMGRNNDRSLWRTGPYDVYRQKGGHNAQLRFLILAKELQDRKIDPVRYMKVMCNYGHYKISKYLPHPTWLASDKAVQQYEWLQYGRMNQTHRQDEWLKLRGRSFRSQDVLRAIEQAAEFLNGARKNFKMSEVEAVLGFIWELSPWFITAYVCSATKKQSDLVTQLARTRRETHRDIQDCLKFFVQNKPIWRRAKETLLRVLG